MKLTGKARHVFPFLALLAKYEGGMTFKELWLSWNFGRPVENLESVDFNLN